MFKHTVILGALFGLVSVASPALADESNWGSCESAIKSCTEKDGEFQRLTDAVASACKEISDCNLSKKQWKAEKTWLKNAKKSCKKKCGVDFKKDRKGEKACKQGCGDAYDRGWSDLLSDERANKSRKYCRQKYQSQDCKRARTELGGYLAKRTLSCGASLYFACNAKK
ncbi:MAG: hypothetical protein KC613_12090 [Myxococcales bacterium]|nr:hypothetical protein [Myxococcales bacterium]